MALKAKLTFAIFNKIINFKKFCEKSFMLQNMKRIKYSVCFKIPRTYIFVPNIFMFPILNALVSENYLRFKNLDT